MVTDVSTEGKKRRNRGTRGECNLRCGGAVTARSSLKVFRTMLMEHATKVLVRLDDPEFKSCDLRALRLLR